MVKKVTVHAGHNAPGKIACGASDYLDESKETRVICRKVVTLLRRHGISAVNCTVNNGKNQSDVLRRIRAKIEAEKSVDVNVSLHMNACRHEAADGKTKGVEVCIKPLAGDNKYYTKTKATAKYKLAERICENMAEIGFTNRGVKLRDDLYILNQTSKPTVLVELCFVDDKDDAELYKKNKKEIARAIVRAVKIF